MQSANTNIELKELSVTENIDRITLLVCTQNKLTDLQKILNFKNNNANFLSLEYSNSAVNQKLLSICEKYENWIESNTVNLAHNEIHNEKNETRQNTPNYTLEFLCDLENLGVRGYNACKSFNLLTLNDLIAFYNANGDFLKVRNCGKKSNEELITICEKYKNYQFIESSESAHENSEEILGSTIFQLAKKENISIRSQNVCEGNGLINLGLILEYYFKNGDFKKLRNCGFNSNSELIAVCSKYSKYKEYNNSIIQIPKIEKQANPLIIKIDNLTTKQKAVLNNIIYSKFNQLSVRSKNALSLLLQDSITVRAIKEEFFEIEDYDFKKIKNVGELTEKEIETFTNEVKELIELVSLFEDNEILREYFNSYLIKNYQISHDTINKIGRDYDFSLGYPIFKTIYHLVDGNYLFDEKEKTIFFGLLNFFNGSKPPLIKDFKSGLKLTRERFRQIRNKTLKKIPNIIYGLFSLELNYDNLNTYQLSLDDEFLYLSDEDILEINRNENVNFNSQFIVYIFSILLKNTHDLIGDTENVFFNKSTNNQHNWNNFYLVQKDFTWIFDFDKLIQDVYVRLSSKIEEDYKFYFQSYLLNFQNENCVSKLDTITTICETLLFSEFELTIDLEENIVFKKNTFKQVYEYAYEALEKLGVPSKVDAICKKVRELYPDYKTDEDSIRASMQRKTGFVPFGRTSVYGLKVWEEEKDIRGGTIRDIAEEFLMKHSEPKHIDEITDFVNKYRDTNAKNIYANLSMEENNRFIFFKGLMVGLKSIKYERTNLIKTDNVQVERKTWEERFSQLKTFAQNNNRLPNSSGIELEQQLYRFMNVQLNRAEKGIIEQTKALLIRELVNIHNYKKSKRMNSKKNEVLFDELEKFIMENNRLPRANYEEEKRLYHFLFRQNKQFKDDNLSGEELNKYLKVKNLLKAII
ncbi:hypothetical protein MASR2M47_00720 [Draconibacterium sp.]